METPITIWVTFSKLFNILAEYNVVPQFPHLQNENNSIVYLFILFTIKEVMFKAYVLAHGVQ
jgi:hypothetical protein